MRIRKNSEFAKLHYSKEVCILNQNPWEISGPWFPSQAQIDGENDDFCGLASFGNTVKDLLSEIIPEEGKDKRAIEEPVYCSFKDASGFNCGVEAKSGSQYCEVHLQLPKKSSTCSGTSSKRSAKKVNRGLKRKRDQDSSTGGEILYYAGFPGLRRKRGRPPLASRAAAANNVDESQ